MPHSASAKKRNRQNLRNRDRNRTAKSELRSSIRRVLEVITAGDVASAREHFQGATRSADQAASAGTIHRNRAARIKSRLSARVLAASQGTGTAAVSKGGKPAEA